MRPVRASRRSPEPIGSPGLSWMQRSGSKVRVFERQIWSTANPEPNLTLKTSYTDTRMGMRT